MVEATAKRPEADSLVPFASRGENAVIWTLWLTYGAFYFCRTNLSAAVPGMQRSMAEGGLGLSGEETGWILASLKIAYGLGQFLNGQLSERISPRVMLALGMFGSATLNVLFGLSTSFYFLLFVWATNGFCQSLGWTPCVRVMANWIPIPRRGKAIGIIGTGYQITLGLTYLIAGQSAEWLGWQGALYVPAALLASTGVVMLIFLRERPTDEVNGNSESLSKITAANVRMPIAEALYWTLYNPTLWLLGLTLGLLNACRYGYFDWGLKHLVDTQKLPIGKASLQFFVIAIGATAGSYLAGWATDRFFGSRRAPVICILMAALGGLSLAYHSIVQQSAMGTVLMLVAIGFCIIGPQVLLVGTAPADLAHRGASAAAAGFVNFMGYMGAATGDVVTGYFSGQTTGWQSAIYMWAAWAFAGALVTALLWRTTAQKVGVFPGSFPKLAAIVSMSLSAAALVYGGQSMSVQMAAFAGVGCFLPCFAVRWVALPGMMAAAAALVGVFVATVEVKSTTWDQAMAMLACGLSLIAGLMILIEQKEPPCA